MRILSTIFFYLFMITDIFSQISPLSFYQCSWWECSKPRGWRSDLFWRRESTQCGTDLAEERGNCVYCRRRRNRCGQLPEGKDQKLLHPYNGWLHRHQIDGKGWTCRRLWRYRGWTLRVLECSLGKCAGDRIWTEIGLCLTICGHPVKTPEDLKIYQEFAKGIVIK